MQTLDSHRSGGGLGWDRICEFQGFLLGEHSFHRPVLSYLVMKVMLFHLLGKRHAGPRVYASFDMNTIYQHVKLEDLVFVRKTFDIRTNSCMSLIF